MKRSFVAQQPLRTTHLYITHNDVPHFMKVKCFMYHIISPDIRLTVTGRRGIRWTIRPVDEITPP